MTSERISVLRKDIPERRLVTIVALLYSLVIIATIVPALARSATLLLLLPYYLIVPGYCVTLLFGENYDIIQRLLFSVFASISIYVSLSAVREAVAFSVPPAIALPVISIAIIVYGYYFHRW